MRASSRSTARCVTRVRRDDASRPSRPFSPASPTSNRPLATAPGLASAGTDRRFPITISSYVNTAGGILQVAARNPAIFGEEPFSILDYAHSNAESLGSSTFTITTLVSEVSGRSSLLPSPFRPSSPRSTFRLVIYRWKCATCSPPLSF